MSDVGLTIDGHRFAATFNHGTCPRTVAAFQGHLPFERPMVHVRWSGEALWAPLGDFDFGVGFEAATSYPTPGTMLLYPGGVSETELILAYGPTRFASRAGQLAGNSLLTIVGDLDLLAGIGREALWSGRREMRIAMG